MFAKLWRWLFASRDHAHTSAVKLERARAYARLRDAENRGDTRDIGRATMRLRQATTDTLRAELGR